MTVSVTFAAVPRLFHLLTFDLNATASDFFVLEFDIFHLRIHRRQNDGRYDGGQKENYPVKLIARYFFEQEIGKNHRKRQQHAHCRRKKYEYVFERLQNDAAAPADFAEKPCKVFQCERLVQRKRERHHDRTEIYIKPKNEEVRYRYAQHTDSDLINLFSFILF